MKTEIKYVVAAGLLIAASVFATKTIDNQKMENEFQCGYEQGTEDGWKIGYGYAIDSARLVPVDNHNYIIVYGIDDGETYYNEDPLIYEGN